MRNFSAGIPNKSSQITNIISKNKKPYQSDFRVHFTLMNVKWKSKQHNKLIQYVVGVINAMCRTQIAQISAIIQDDIFDVSIGLYNDFQAFQFLRKKPIIVLSDGAKEHDYEPRVSRVFQSFINKMEKQPSHQAVTSNLNIGSANFSSHNKSQSRQQIPSIAQIQWRHSRSQQTKNINDFDQLSKNMDLRLKQKQASIGNDKQVSKILAFGIPKQYQIAEVRDSLKAYGISTGECKWKFKQQMQYLQIDLIQPISKASVYYLSLEIDGFPYIALPLMQQSQIMRQLARYTVQIIIRAVHDQEQKFMQAMNDIGGVNIMLRTPLKQKDDYRYVVVFNNVENAQKACKVARDLKQCSVQRKQYELKIGRVNKFFTFTALMKSTTCTKNDNISQYFTTYSSFVFADANRCLQYWSHSMINIESKFMNTCMCNIGSILSLLH